MAGNVTASLVANSDNHTLFDLVIVGDSQSNSIGIVETATNGEFTITGLVDSSNQPTTVNLGGSATIGGVTGNIVIDMQAGDDALMMTAINHSGDLTVEMGDGNDAISIGGPGSSVSVGGTATFHVGDNQNRVALSHFTVVGNLFLDAVGAAARTIPNTYSVADSSFQQNAILQLGNRAGSISVSRVTVGNRLELDNAEPEPPYGAFPFQGFAALTLDDAIVSGHLEMQSWGSALIRMNNVFVGLTARFEAFQSYNAIQLHNSRIVNELTVSTLVPRFGPLGPFTSEYDDLSISGIIVDGGMLSNTSGSVRVVYSNINHSIITTERHDVVTIDTNILGAMTIRLGGGYDSLTFANSIVYGELTVSHSRFQQSGPGDPVQRGYDDFTSTMGFASSQIGTLNIVGGNSTDEVRITYSIVYQIFADMDLESQVDGNRAGSDLFELNGSILGVEAQLDGSGGFDLFRNNGSAINRLALVNFEAVQG